MPRQIVTPEIVQKTAEELIQQGSEVTLLSVQSRIGGGSYTTVKRLLDEWKTKRSTIDPSQVNDLPPEISEKAREFAIATWIHARTLSNKDLQATKEAANEEITQVKTELDQALQEVARLESVEVQREEQAFEHERKIRELEIALVDAKSQVKKMGALEKSLESMQKEVLAKSVEVGKAQGEIETLRAQVENLTGTIRAFGKGK